MKTLKQLCDLHTQAAVAALIGVTPAAVSVAYNGSVSASMLAKMHAVFGDEFDVVATLREHRAADYANAVPLRLQKATRALETLTTEERRRVLRNFEANEHASQAA